MLRAISLLLLPVMSSGIRLNDPCNNPNIIIDPADAKAVTFDELKAMDAEFPLDVINTFWYETQDKNCRMQSLIQKEGKENCINERKIASFPVIDKSLEYKAVPPLVHQMGPADTTKWAAWLKSWNVPGLNRTIYHDDDLEAIVKETVPHLYDVFMSMEASVEKADFSRYVLLYKYGGIYADMDVELKNVDGLKSLMAKGMAVLPFEKNRLVGQSIMIAPPKHPFMRQAMQYLAENYNHCCYAVLNTGPDGLTKYWNSNGACEAHKGSTALTKTLLNGQVAHHHQTGVWKDADQIRKKHGQYGCSFKPVECVGCGSCVID